MQVKPSTSPKAGAPTTDSSGSRTASQVFGEEVGSCPSGTIPLRNIGGSGSKIKGLQTANASHQFTHEVGVDLYSQLTTFWSYLQDVSSAQVDARVDALHYKVDTISLLFDINSS